MYLPVSDAAGDQVTKDQPDQERELGDVHLPGIVTHQVPLEEAKRGDVRWKTEGAQSSAG